MYTNCPTCHLSINVRWPAIAPQFCPRCLARHGKRVTMFSSPLPYARVTAEPGTREGGGLEPRSA